MQNEQINFRCDKEMKMYLLAMDDYSTYIRDAIIEKGIRERDPKIIEAKVHEYEKAIRDLKQAQTKAQALGTDIDILRKWNQEGTKRGVFEGDPNLIYKWVDSKVLPELRKAGYLGYDVHQIINKLSMLDKKEGGEGDI